MIREPWCREQSGPQERYTLDMADFFDLKNNGTNLRTEIFAGVTTFLSGMYIIVVNPALLRTVDMPYSAVLTATVLVSAFTSILMGLYTNNPILVAPGMSINQLFVYAISRSEGIPYEVALGCVFNAGLVFLVLMVLDRKKRLLSAIPPMLRYGLAGGIGLFIALIGLESAGFIVSTETGGWAPGALNATTLTFLAGFLITAVLVVRKVRGSFILGILATTVLAWPIGRLWGTEHGQGAVVNWSGWYAAPDFSLLMHLDILGAARLSLWFVVFVFLFTCVFDSLATCVGVCEAGDLVDERGDPRHLVRCLRVNAVGVMLSALAGTSPATAYIESSTGIREGGRTGLTAVVAGLLFIPFMFLSPLLSIVPSLSTAPMLVLAGVFMLRPLIYVRWERFDDAIPFFMAMIIMPLTHSITHGIIWGCLSWTIIKVACGKTRQISFTLVVVDVMALILLFDLDHYF